MKFETYTPGHTSNATSFMAKRTLESHGQFFAPYLETGLAVLDLGCGPGTISAGLAQAVSPGLVTGIDFGESQIDQARRHTEDAAISNVEFREGSCYELPFPDRSFDRVFSHALMEHLERPVDALKEAHRVLKPGGMIGICSPDADGFLLSPPSPELSEAVECYADLQKSNGGDLRIGKRFGVLLKESGFSGIQLSARYECYPSLEFVGEYLALQLEQNAMMEQAQILRTWSQQPGGMFAQPWVSAVGTRAPADS